MMQFYRQRTTNHADPDRKSQSNPEHGSTQHASIPWRVRCIDTWVLRGLIVAACLIRVSRKWNERRSRVYASAEIMNFGINFATIKPLHTFEWFATRIMPSQNEPEVVALARTLSDRNNISILYRFALVQYFFESGRSLCVYQKQGWNFLPRGLSEGRLFIGHRLWAAGSEQVLQCLLFGLENMLKALIFYNWEGRGVRKTFGGLQVPKLLAVLDGAQFTPFFH